MLYLRSLYHVSYWANMYVVQSAVQFERELQFELRCDSETRPWLGQRFLLGFDTITFIKCHLLPQKGSENTSSSKAVSLAFCKFYSLDQLGRLKTAAHAHLSLHTTAASALRLHLLTVLF